MVVTSHGQKWTRGEKEEERRRERLLSITRRFSDSPRHHGSYLGERGPHMYQKRRDACLTFEEVHVPAGEEQIIMCPLTWGVASEVDSEDEVAVRGRGHTAHVQVAELFAQVDALPIRWLPRATAIYITPPPLKRARHSQNPGVRLWVMRVGALGI